jgi:hypothetical protein
MLTAPDTTIDGHFGGDGSTPAPPDVLILSDTACGYHLGYETTKTYQAEMRRAVAQERRARRAQAGHHGNSAARVMALLHQVHGVCSRRWSTKQAATAETGASPDVSVVLR